MPGIFKNSSGNNVQGHITSVDDFIWANDYFISIFKIMK